MEEQRGPEDHCGTGSLSKNSGTCHSGEQLNPESPWPPCSRDMVGQDLPRHLAC